MGFQLDNISKTEGGKISPKKESILKKEITLFGSGFSNKLKEDFYTELSVLLKAGITLKDALELIVKPIKKVIHKDRIGFISQNLVSGNSFSESVRNQKGFTDYEYFSIKIGEETGTLAQVIEQLAAFYGRKNEQRRELIGAITYPMIIFCTAILVVVFMLQFVVPMFQDIFEQQKMELPAITKFIVSASDFMKAYGWIFLVVIVVLVLLRGLFNKKIWFRKFKDKFLLRIPYVGNFIKTVYLSQFTQAVSLLTASKVPVVNSIQLVKKLLNSFSFL